MPFPRRLLAEHEEMILDLRPHPIALVPPAFWGALVVAAAAVAFNKMPAGSRQGPLRIAVLAVAGVLMLFFVLPQILRWATTHFVLTSDRLILRRGVIAKYGKEIPLERINDVTFRQSIWERVIGAGDLVVESAGEQGQQPITDVRRPEAVQKEIYRQAEANQQRMSTQTVAAPALSIPEQIGKLAELRDRGVLTEEEFQAKKAALLRQMG
ncbi:MAG: PH domain-containing protein [Actinomycetota bacterium]